MRRKKESKNKLYVIIFIVVVILVIWLGTKDIPNEAQETAVDVTEQIKSAK